MKHFHLQNMIVPIVFLIISGQALAFHIQQPKSNCAENPITPKSISDLKELSGEWYGLYYWYNNAVATLATKVNECPKIEVFKATEEDIEDQKHICQNTAPTDFEFNKLEIIIQVLEHKALIAKGEDYDISLSFCSYVGRMQFMMVTDDVVLISTPEADGMKSLIARKVISDEELQCIVDNIAGLDGYNGHPFC